MTAIAPDGLSSFTFESDPGVHLIAIGYDHLHTAFEDGFKVIRSGHIPEFSLWRKGCLGVEDLNGARTFRAKFPLGNVNVMGADIGDIASVVIMDPPTVHLQTGATVISVGRRALPHIVVQAVWNAFWLRPMTLFVDILIPSNQSYFHGVNLPNAPVPHILTSQAVMLVRTALASRLPRDARFLHGIAHQAPLLNRQGKWLLPVIWAHLTLAGHASDPAWQSLRYRGH